MNQTILASVLAAAIAGAGTVYFSQKAFGNPTTSMVSGGIIHLDRIGKPKLLFRGTVGEANVVFVRQDRPAAKAPAPAPSRPRPPATASVSKKPSPSPYAW